jgi:hypothetical protein
MLIRTLEERFIEKIDWDGPIMPNMTTPCWLWIGAKVPKGYGQIRFEGKSVGAARVAWFLVFGVLPEMALHHCDNPPCVRFDHLYDGNHQNNTDDAVNRKRMASGPRHGLVLHPERIARGVQLPQTRVLPLERRDLLSRRGLGESVTSLASEYGISRSQVYRICQMEGF